MPKGSSNQSPNYRSNRRPVEPLAVKNAFARLALAVLLSAVLVPCLSGARASAQSVGSAGTIERTVTDSSGAVVPGASVTLESQATGYKRSTTADETGAFKFDNIPQNNYELSVGANGFGTVTQGVSIRSAVPISLKIALAPAGTQNSVTVTAADTSVENVDVPHVDLDLNRIEKYTLPSPGAGLNDLVALTSPSVAKDSNGFFHPLGDHAQTTFVIDNQPISDQRSKAFSTQLPVDAIQSLEIDSGAVPAWDGEKSSLIVNVVT
ncbi:MAG: carboxypeptidase-like regulatory domain-containing protein, partial [Blastocatellia bacterium]